MPQNKQAVTNTSKVGTVTDTISSLEHGSDTSESQSSFSESVPAFQPDTPLESIPVTALDRRKSRSSSNAGERRGSTQERRAGLDRRVVDIGTPTGLERRRGPGRRLSEDRKSAEEGNMSDEQFEFILALDTYKRLNNRPFPSWTEVLEVVKQLGYRKVSQSTISLSNATPRASGPAAQTAGADSAVSASAESDSENQIFHG
jgi:hypothetical protein